MAYNNVNLSINGSSTMSDSLGHPLPNQYSWSYTTADNLATVFGTDPITGNHYFHGENKLRQGDWISIYASDGDAWANVVQATTTGATVRVTQVTP